MKYFTAMIKPASSLCNMRCSYCFYADVSENREIKSHGIMNNSTAEKLIDRIFDYISSPATINIAFQGGEPTLAGLEYFVNFVEYANSKNTEGAHLNFSIQTNGFSLDEKWGRFFSDKKFLVGISLDAVSDIHDYYRRDTKNRGTYDNVSKTLRMFDKYKVDYNILTVISRQVAKHPDLVYKSLKRKKTEHVQLIPCLVPLDENINFKTDLTPELYSGFMKRFFDLWEKDFYKGDFMYVREFENILAGIMGLPAEQCGMQGQCTPQFIVEANGDVFPCDFYVLDRYRAGSVINDPIETISKSPNIKKFINEKEPLHPLCGDCKVFSLCMGGCRRYRSFYNSVPEYCPYQDFLYYSADRFIKIARSLESG